MNEKKAKRLRWATCRLTEGRPAVEYKPLVPVTVGLHPNTARFLGQVELHPHCVRAVYHKLKREHA